MPATQHVHFEDSFLGKQLKALLAELNKITFQQKPKGQELWGEKMRTSLANVYKSIPNLVQFDNVGVLRLPGVSELGRLKTFLEDQTNLFKLFVKDGKFVTADGSTLQSQVPKDLDSKSLQSLTLFSNFLLEMHRVETEKPDQATQKFLGDFLPWDSLVKGIQTSDMVEIFEPNKETYSFKIRVSEKSWAGWALSKALAALGKSSHGALNSHDLTYNTRSLIEAIGEKYPKLVEPKKKEADAPQPTRDDATDTDALVLLVDDSTQGNLLEESDSPRAFLEQQMQAWTTQIKEKEERLAALVLDPKLQAGLESGVKDKIEALKDQIDDIKTGGRSRRVEKLAQRIKENEHKLSRLEKDDPHVEGMLMLIESLVNSRQEAEIQLATHQVAKPPLSEEEQQKLRNLEQELIQQEAYNTEIDALRVTYASVLMQKEKLELALDVLKDMQKTGSAMLEMSAQRADKILALQREEKSAVLEVFQKEKSNALTRTESEIPLLSKEVESLRHAIKVKDNRAALNINIAHFQKSAPSDTFAKSQFDEYTKQLSATEAVLAPLEKDLASAESKLQAAQKQQSVLRKSIASHEKKSNIFKTAIEEVLKNIGTADFAMTEIGAYDDVIFDDSTSEEDDSVESPQKLVIPKEVQTLYDTISNLAKELGKAEDSYEKTNFLALKTDATLNADDPNIMFLVMLHRIGTLLLPDENPTIALQSAIVDVLKAMNKLSYTQVDLEPKVLALQAHIHTQTVERQAFLSITESLDVSEEHQKAYKNDGNLDHWLEQIDATKIPLLSDFPGFLKKIDDTYKADAFADPDNLGKFKSLHKALAKELKSIKKETSNEAKAVHALLISLQNDVNHHYKNPKILEVVMSARIAAVKPTLQHRKTWQMVLVNIAAACTGVGLLVLAGMLIHAKATGRELKTALFFSETNEQQKITKIEELGHKLKSAPNAPGK
ncbi:MAG: hypothetical protein Q8R79_07305 [Legionellaceae bacterium]|nr:hypothetical protein [Legionellaceae bacterium]